MVQAVVTKDLNKENNNENLNITSCLQKEDEIEVKETLGPL